MIIIIPNEGKIFHDIHKNKNKHQMILKKKKLFKKPFPLFLNQQRHQQIFFKFYNYATSNVESINC